MPDTYFFDPEKETLSRGELMAVQQRKLQQMFEVVFEHNRFYREKFQSAGWQGVPELDDWQRFPFTSKAELLSDAQARPPYGSNLTFPLDRYVRVHQTSGTTGNALSVLDTLESWQAWKSCWGYIYCGASLVPGDRIYVAFSFGLFAGFWAAYEAAPDFGYRVIPGGGQTSVQRLRAMVDHGATVLLCTPSYALHLAQVAKETGTDLRASPVRVTIHAGEPGASIPATKKRIEEAWNAKCFDHIGASEVGPYGFECHVQPGGVHVNELDYICEVVDPETLEPKAAGELGELVLTNLNRWGFPVIRYRTGDLVRLSSDSTCECGRTFRLLSGGIVARADDMMTIRGVNIYPSAVEAILREFPEVEEFQGETWSSAGLDELRLRIELSGGLDPIPMVARVKEALRHRLGLRIEVEIAPPRSLPRYELKARRFKRL